MHKLPTIIRSTARQLLILLGLIGITFAAGINWAEAATADATGPVPGAFHVIFLFLLTLGVMAHMVVKPQQRARVRTRRKKSRFPRRY